MAKFILTKSGLNIVEAANTKKELRAAKKALSKVYGKSKILIYKRVKEFED